MALFLEHQHHPPPSSQGSKIWMCSKNKKVYNYCLARTWKLSLAWVALFFEYQHHPPPLKSHGSKIWICSKNKNVYNALGEYVRIATFFLMSSAYRLLLIVKTRPCQAKPGWPGNVIIATPKQSSKQKLGGRYYQFTQPPPPHHHHPHRPGNVPFQFYSFRLNLEQWNLAYKLN